MEKSRRVNLYPNLVILGLYLENYCLEILVNWNHYLAKKL